MNTLDLIEEGKKHFAKIVKEKGRMHEDARIFCAILNRLVDKHELAEDRLNTILENERLIDNVLEKYLWYSKDGD